MYVNNNGLHVHFSEEYLWSIKEKAQEPHKIKGVTLTELAYLLKFIYAG